MSIKMAFSALKPDLVQAVIMNNDVFISSQRALVAS
jgi:hypothetical protein